MPNQLGDILLERLPRHLLNKIAADYNTSPRRYRKKPFEYVAEYCGVIWDKQRQIIQSFETAPHRVLVRSGHKVGKSWLNAALITYAYECCGPCRVIVTAPTKDTLKDTLFGELRRNRPNLPGLKPVNPEASMRPGWDIMARATNRGEAFQGRHGEIVYLFFDEATGIHPIYFEAGTSMHTGVQDMGSWVCTYNPLDITSYVYFLEQTGLWDVISISQLEHPNIQAELNGLAPPYPSAVRLNQVITSLDEYGTRLSDRDPEYPNEVVLTWKDGRKVRWLPGPIADARVLGRWPQEGINTVWTESLWNRVMGIRRDVDPKWKVQIGCDVARYGDDATTIWVRKGIAFMEAHEIKKASTKQIADILKNLCWQYKADRDEKQIPVLIDGIGVGGGVVDNADGFKFIDVQSSAKPSREDCHNFRSELWIAPLEHAKEDLIDLSRIPKNMLHRLRNELLGARYIITPDNKYLVESKDRMKERLKRSPDYADGFNLACYWVH